ncbi:hypothetical protein GCM10010909_32780 [Acidocella aquatica]|uniref:SnoaL-like domain-containing protein n=1 Tax=Acidocella aquatica TaxID=1922313 RepID=A0ABQ6AA14_9PROT|nr:nuclear transport factor 2 family protein [Acidocella aquatica]GLR68597.1 hypothetical protein GCM10010909_32780 [Acidocella aquatica]
MFTGPIEDRLAIRELVEAYGDAVTRADKQAWEQNWTEDAVWTLNLPGLEKVEGRKAIVELWVQAMAGYEFVLMSSSPGAIQVEGNHATGRFYTSEVARTKDGTTQRVSGRYEDEYVKQEGRWYIHRRTFKVLYTQDVTEKAGA